MQTSTTNWQDIERYLQTFSTISTDFLQQLNQRSVISRQLKVQAQALPDTGCDFESMINTLKEDVIPHLSASNGPRYWDFVTGGANPVASLADWLATTFNQNTAKTGDSIGTAIEYQALQ